MQTIEDKHPLSLRIFFATEMWERYGFYVVQSLLALYLVFHFKWQDKEIYALVGSFTALTYLSPVVGGWIADHLIGQKRTILLGSCFLFFSYLALAFMHSAMELKMALASIAIGTGLLKPNISSLLGNEYDKESSQRENGFTIFYMGITSGIILGTTLPSHLKNYFGWPISFMSASLGMIIATVIFIYGIHRYKIKDYCSFEFKPGNFLKACLIVLLLWIISFYILNNPHFADSIFTSIAFLSLAYLVYTAKNEPAFQARKTFVIGLLCIISVMFWAFYFQMFLSLTLLISRIAEPRFLGIDFPAPFYVGIQSIGMVIFGYFISRKKNNLTLKQQGLRIGNKFLGAMIFITLAYGLIAWVCSFKDSHLLSPMYFIPAYLLISLAELLLSPVGLSAITLLASRKKVSTMMGIFFVSLGVGGFLSGKLAALTSIETTGLSVLSLKSSYYHSFTQIWVILLCATITSFFLNKKIKSLFLLSNAAQETSSPTIPEVQLPVA